MKPAAFSYHRVVTVEHAVHLLDELGESARIIAGGQSLVPLMNFRLARPDHLVDITAISDLDYISPIGGAGIEIGGLATHSRLEHHPGFTGGFRAIPRTARWIGHPAIRNRGTLAGSLAHADPAGEWPTLMTALDASVAVSGPTGSRDVPIGDLIHGSYTTSLGPADMITSVRIPHRPDTAGFVEYARRHGDFALAMAAVAFDLTDGTITSPRVAIGGVGGRPTLAPAAAAILDGQVPDPDLFRECADTAASETAVQADAKASADYRTHLVKTLVERACTDAITSLEQGVTR